MGQKNGKLITLSLLNDRGKIRLRWRYNSIRFTLSTSLTYNDENLVSVKVLAKLIKADIRKNKFDTSLNKYKSFNYKAPIQPLKNEGNIKPQKPIKPFNKPLIADFEYWTINYRQKNCERHIDYNSCRGMLKRWGLFKIEDALSYLNKETFNYKTYNRRLNLLLAFYKWAVKHKGYSVNPFEDVLPKTGKKVNNPQREPLTEEEAVEVLKAIKNDTHVPKSSHYKHSHYYPFLFFIYKTGCRNAEAVGVRVKHIDLEKNLITIEEAMARNLNRTNGNARIRKETKNGKVRQIPLNPELREVIEPLMTDKKPDDLLFVSFTGLPIDDKMFQRRVLKPVLKALKIEERDLYCFRHGFNSKCIAAGISPVITAQLLGNNPETALRFYTHQLELPALVP